MHPLGHQQLFIKRGVFRRCLRYKTMLGELDVRGMERVCGWKADAIMQRREQLRHHHIKAKRHASMHCIIVERASITNRSASSAKRQ